jgi:hypothetical protein
MRFVGTLMLLACAAMLLFPSLWEGRWPTATAPGRSTLTAEDLAPAWRGPTRGTENGG